MLHHSIFLLTNTPPAVMIRVWAVRLAMLSLVFLRRKLANQASFRALRFEVKPTPASRVFRFAVYSLFPSFLYHVC
jgi:hypothetical protein